MTPEPLPPPSMRSRFTTKRVVFGVLVLAIVVAIGVYAKFRSTTVAVDEHLLVTVKRQDLRLEILDTGKVEAKERVSIKSNVPGQVTEVLVDEGDVVKKGQLLIRLDQTEYARAVASAEAQLMQAQSAYDLATSVLARKDKGQLDHLVTPAEVEAARAEQQMRAGQKRASEIALLTAKDKLLHTLIKSPLDGTVIERGIESGEMVTPGVEATFEGKALLVVADVSTLRVRTELNQIDAAKVNLGHPVTVTLDAVPNQTFNAIITKVAPAAVKATGRDAEVFPVEATLELHATTPTANANAAAPAQPSEGAVVASTTSNAIKAGMTADVRILVGKKEAVLVLPIEAVVTKDGKSHVKRKTERDGKTEYLEVEVKRGQENDREVEIATGLSEGDVILLDPPSSKDNEAKL